eukprot:GFKZ01001812.1.p1 GENE.GFKZ01001812.1~~GFKZ01001812.1.p1  ORF type:complete len:2430 (-),score=256.79 GFKZ01001812.1:1035-8324(-)
MVSLSSLLAAALDKPLESQAAASFLVTPTRDCVLPPALPPDSLPPRLRAVLAVQSASLSDSNLSISATNSGAALSAPLASRLGNPPLPLQRLLEDLGPEATAPQNMASLARTLAHFGRPSETAVSSALLFLATADPPPESAIIDNHTMFHLFAMFCSDPENASLDPAVQRAVASTSPSASEWRVDILVQAVTTVAGEFNSPLDWRLVIRSLDVDGLEKQLSRSAFVQIAKAFIKGSGGSLIPADCILESWVHPAAQISILSQALLAPEYINWDPVEAFPGATPEDLTSPYSRVLLVEKLVELYARDLLQYALQQNSNLVLLSLTCSKPKSNTSLLQKLTVTLLTPLITGFPNNEKTLRQMWNVTPALVEAGIISMWKKNPRAVETAFAIAVDLRFLQELLNSGTSVEFSLELAMVAYREEVINLESWLIELLTSRGLVVVSALTVHMAKRMRVEEPVLPAELSVNAVRIIFRCLIACASRLSGTPDASNILETVQDVHQAYVRFNSRLADLSPSADLSDPKLLLGSNGTGNLPVSNGSPQKAPPGPVDTDDSLSEAASYAASLLIPAQAGPNSNSTSFPNAIEKEVDVFFNRFYDNGMSNEETLIALRRFKESSVDYERQVFQCAMHTLFDEYRFLKKYPERELEKTGRLFGSIINERLLSAKLQGLAAKTILDALCTIKPSPHPVGRLGLFGMFAVERFKPRLAEWPQYSQLVLKLPRLAAMKPAFISELKRMLESYRGPIPSVAERDIELAVPAPAVAPEPVGQSSPPPPYQREEKPSIAREPNPDTEDNRGHAPSPTPSTSSTPRRDTIGGALDRSPSMSNEGALALSSMNLTNLLGITIEEASQISAPDDVVQDKIKFIFNNLSHSTMDDKVVEMLDILDADYIRFFSIYIVVKRASSESNFHHIYLTLLERMAPKLPTLFPLVFDTTYKRVRVLLASKKIVATPSERMVLKSLGSWIGSLTLARNQPILRRDLDLKELLKEAYSTGRLIAVVPFVAKVLEASQKSEVFKTTNPWIRGILSLMKEIYGVDDLKLNLKFELQLLCKGLKLDVNEVMPSDLLRDRPAPDKNNNPDFNTKKPASASPIRSSASPTSSPSPELRGGYAQGSAGRTGVPTFSLADPQPSSAPLPTIPLGPNTSGRVDVGTNLIPNSLSMNPETVGDLTNMLANASLTPGNVSVNQLPRGSIHSASGVTGSNVPSSGPTQRLAGSLSSNEGTLVPNLAAYISISPSLVLFQNNPSLKRLLPLAIDRAIREIIQPVVERSCAIAFLTTKELTLKDFANEPDTSKVRRAALQMVQQLAGSLALVTSKEPLRVSMGNQLRSLLSPVVVGDQSLVEQTSQVICASNLEVGCAVIERHAKEKAARDLNEKIAPAFAARRPQHSSYGIPMLPGPEVLRVYDDFARLPRHGVVSSQYSNITPQQSQQSNQPLRHGSNVSVNVPTSATNDAVGRVSNGHSHFIPEQRTNGNGADPKFTDPRSSGAPPRGANMGHVHSEISGHASIIGRRQTISGQSTVDTRPSATAYGTPLPFSCNPSEVSSALQNAVGSSVSALHNNVHGSQASGANTATASGEEALSTQQVLERFNAVYGQIIGDIGELVSAPSSSERILADVPGDHDIHSLWVQIPAAVKKSVTADEAGMAVAQKVFKGLYEGDSYLHREVHVLILDGLRESCRRLSKELVSWLAYSEERKKLHRECIVALLKRKGLLHITNYDELLAKTIDNGRNINALDFACFLVRQAVIKEQLATAAELALTLEVMTKVGRRSSSVQLPSAPEGLLALVEASRKVIPQANNMVQSGLAGEANHSSLSRHQHQQQFQHQVKELEPMDPPGAREQIAGVLADWQRLIASDMPHRPLSEHLVGSFLNHVKAALLGGEEARERFGRVAVELVIAVTNSALQSSSSNVPGELSSAPYTVVDSTVRLIGTLTRSELGADGLSRSVQLLCHFMAAVVRCMLKTSAGADLRPHFRLFAGLITELGIGAGGVDKSAAGNGYASEAEPPMEAMEWELQEFPSITSALHFLDDKAGGFFAFVRRFAPSSSRDAICNLKNFQVLSCIAGALSACSPLVAPSFAFSWLQLMSNKELLPRLLAAPALHGGNMFLRLLVAMLRFLHSYLKNPHVPLTEGVRVLYKGTLRVLLVLLHDFPEFLCDYHMAIVDVIPHNCVQLRNIVLASFPKSMRLPDPFLPELKVDQLPEMSSRPRILTDFSKHLDETGLRAKVDEYLAISPVRSPSAGGRPGIGSQSAPPLLESYLTENGASSGSEKYSVASIGALVLYVGEQGINRSHPSPPNVDGAVMDLIRSLTRELAPEGQYHLFNAIANQLRYPNCHTLYYSRLVLYLFHESTEESVKEQITRVLLERLIANRPHPWGLLVTFVELVKNTTYNFWQHEFVRCAPEIEELFENVAKVCLGPVMQTQQQSLTAAS